MPIQNTYKIEKSNLLNEIRDNKMSLQELRFFNIYLSKINARDVSTRCVRFPLSDFQKIMNIGRMNIKNFKKAVNGLLCKVVHMPTDDGGLSSFQLFKEVKLFKDDAEKWCVEIDAHDNALPLFFNLKGNYFTYELWNALRLKSACQLRMYELLKQREKFGQFEIKVSDLRELLGIAPTQYPQLERFKTRVLDSCQKALAENTDICYTYECGKRGARGKWLTIVFHISKNTSYKSPMELDEFIDKQPQPQFQPQHTSEYVPDEPDERSEVPEREYSSENISFLACGCNDEFTDAQMREIFSIISCMDSFIESVYFESVPIKDKWFYRVAYLSEVYAKLNVYAEKINISNRYAYFKRIILNDRNEHS